MIYESRDYIYNPSCWQFPGASLPHVRCSASSTMMTGFTGMAGSLVHAGDHRSTVESCLPGTHTEGPHAKNCQSHQRLV